MSKMLMVSYNEAMDQEVMEALSACALKSYTKIAGVFGRGEASGTHLGDDIWPGKNNLLFVAGGEAEIGKFLSGVRELRKRLGKEGIKAFVWKLEEAT